MASAPDAQADTGACTPARAPNSIETFAAGELGMSMGTVMGRTRRAPFSRTTSQPSSRVHTPPIPDATTAPRRSPSISGEPASAHASRAATTAYCADGSMRLVSGRDRTSAAGTATVPANRTGISYRSAQSLSSVRIPDLPASAASQVLGTSPPSGVVAPRPVITTSGTVLMRCVLLGRGGIRDGRPTQVAAPVTGQAWCCGSDAGIRPARSR